MNRLMVRLYAWLGALMFISALIYCAHFFVTLTPSPAVSSPTVALATNMMLFGLFATHHSVMARSGAKRWLAQHLPPELERSTYVWVSSGLLIITCLLWRDLPGTVYRTTDWLQWLGFAVQASGLIVIALAVSVLDPLELAGVSQALQVKTVADPRRHDSAGPALRVRGPYRWVRHPVYLGWILIVFGAPDMSTARLAFACISTGYILVAIPWEERSMADAFGDDYRRYTATVRWRVMPGLY